MTIRDIVRPSARGSQTAVGLTRRLEVLAPNMEPRPFKGILWILKGAYRVCRWYMRIPGLRAHARPEMDIAFEFSVSFSRMSLYEL